MVRTVLARNHPRATDTTYQPQLEEFPVRHRLRFGHRHSFQGFAGFRDHVAGRVGQLGLHSLSFFTTPAPGRKTAPPELREVMGPRSSTPSPGLKNRKDGLDEPS